MKQPIQITFASKETLMAWSDDPQAFAESILSKKPPEIIDVSYGYHTSVPELQEVTLKLEGGSSILCHIAKHDVAKADFIQEVATCEETRILAYADLARDEAALEERFLAATAIINNVPDLELRLELHAAYLKRRAAYVAALEAIVDGVIRRPENG